MWKYGATWTPGKHHRLGDVGVFDRGLFDRQAHLEGFGIAFDVVEDDDLVDYEYAFADGVEIAWKAEGF